MSTGTTLTLLGGGAALLAYLMARFTPPRLPARIRVRADDRRGPRRD